jgi:hypothetical protein
VAALTASFAGADLKRLVEDAKILLAVDVAAGRSARPIVDYFAQAVAHVRAARDRYAAAESRSRCAEASAHVSIE